MPLFPFPSPSQPPSPPRYSPLPHIIAVSFFLPHSAGTHKQSNTHPQLFTYVLEYLRARFSGESPLWLALPTSAHEQEALLREADYYRLPGLAAYVRQHQRAGAAGAWATDLCDSATFRCDPSDPASRDAAMARLNAYVAQKQAQGWGAPTVQTMAGIEYGGGGGGDGGGGGVSRQVLTLRVAFKKTILNRPDDSAAGHFALAPGPAAGRLLRSAA